MNYLILDPIEKRCPGLLPLRVSQLLHERTGGQSDLYFRRLIKNLKPKIPLPPSSRMDADAIAVSVSELQQRGWHVLPWRFGADDIAEIWRFAFSMPAYANDPREQVHIDEAHIPHEHGRYIWRMSDLIRMPAIQRLLADSTTHQIAQDYIGCRPLLTNIALWLDPVIEGTYNAHVYHYDNDGPAFLKFFIYLHDVDIDTGAHTFIEGSHGRHKPDRFRIAQRYNRDDLLSHYGAGSEKVFAAPAGTILAEDTAGFHKGTTLRKGYRLLLQLQYAMLDIPHEEEIALSITRARIEELDPSIRRIVSKFFV
jgi:hypothetical protein